MCSQNRELISRGSQLESRNTAGRTALIYAASNNHPEVVADLLKAGADINAQDKDGRRTALILASSWGYGEVATTLVTQGGADSSIIDKDGYTALDIAKKYGKEEVVDILSGSNRV